MTDEERLGPPPIEPLSDAAWSRIERALWTQLDVADPTAKLDRSSSPSPRWWVLAAPLVAAAAVAAVVVGTRPSPREVAVTDEPARVVSGLATSAASFGDSHVELDPNTAVVMSHESGHPTVLLERGAAWFTVAPRKERSAFVVHAGDATVQVVGTRFRVARSDERIAVAVERGMVDVQFRGSVVEVGASQHWSSDSPGNISTVAAAPLPSEPVATAQPGTQPVIQRSVDPAAESVADPSIRPDVPGATRTPPEPKSDDKPASKPEAKLEAKPEAKLDTEPKPEPKLRGTQSADIDRERAEYDRLATLEPRDPAAALTGYLTLARGTSRWADPALFAAARLAVDQHDKRAETLLGIYLQRFPSGANATDAKQLLARLKRINGDTP